MELLESDHDFKIFALGIVGCWISQGITGDIYKNYSYYTNLLGIKAYSTHNYTVYTYYTQLTKLSL